MAKKNQQETRTQIDDLNDTLTGLEQKVENNQKRIMWACTGVAAVICLVLLYIYAIRTPGIEKANDAIGQADVELALGNDSIALQQYKQVADEYGYEAGNRAALNAAIILYQKGQYEEAINYLKKYDSAENIIGASSKSLEGDCYVNLKNYEKAAECFKEAAKISDNNPHFTPVFLMKEATVQRELKNYAAEAALYEEIQEKYPEYSRDSRIDFNKYIDRAKMQAEAGK